MRPRLPLSFALLLFAANAAGCVVHVKSGGAGDPKANGAGEQAEGDASPAVAPVEAETPPPADPHAALPDCPGRDSDELYCTQAGKLAGSWMMVDMLRVPETAEELFSAAPADHERQPSLRIAVEGEVLYIRHVSCGSCARVMGQGFEGQLDALDEAQLRALAAKLGLPEDAPLLGTAQQWRDYTAGPGKDILTGLTALAE